MDMPWVIGSCCQQMRIYSYATRVSFRRFYLFHFPLLITTTQDTLFSKGYHSLRQRDTNIDNKKP